MICQSCNKNEACMHMKRIINGKATEVHLCSDCARSLGYGEAYSVSGFGFTNFLRDVLLNTEGVELRAVPCPVCGKTFEEIAEDGKLGCSECYSAFYDKIIPSINRLHGKVKHIGKNPSVSELQSQENYLDSLRSRLAAAVNEQNYQEAAILSDELDSLLKKGGNE